VLNPVYWTLSQEVDGASNGFKLTEGNYSRDTQVQFATGNSHLKPWGTASVV
jgi:hypothetical protein